MILYRPGEERDLPDIAALLVKSWQTHYQAFLPESLLRSLSVETQVVRHRRYLSEGTTYIIAESNGQLAGFASVGPGRSEILATPYELYTLYVDQQQHRKGIGSRLIRETEAMLPAGQALGVWVMADNPFLPFYDRQGDYPAGSLYMERPGFKITFLWSCSQDHSGISNNLQA